MPGVRKLICLSVLVALSAIALYSYVTQEDPEPEIIVQTQQNKNLNVGTIKNTDSLIYSETFNVTGVEKKLQHQDATYIGNKNITFILALNQSPDSSGTVELINGGVGHTNALIRMHSSVIGKGFIYLISIYGKDIENVD